tara:strand:+ start:351 stop:656 length:306 start_codon:yes stop_codon:yes gene_type:complete
MEALFGKWRARTNVPEPKPVVVEKDSLDKNTKMLLNSLLYTNRKHQKQAIPLNYTFDEESNTFHTVDVMEKIAPFSTDKTNLYETSEQDAIAFKNSTKGTK